MDACSWPTIAIETKVMAISGQYRIGLRYLAGDLAVFARPLPGRVFTSPSSKSVLLSRVSWQQLSETMQRHASQPTACSTLKTVLVKVSLRLPDHHI